MDKDQVKNFLERHNLSRVQFAEHLNALREPHGHKPVGEKAIQQWLYNADRSIPAWVDAYLPLIEARLANPEKPVLYQITVVLSKGEEKLLKRTAKRAGVSPEKFLEICARLGFESECRIED
jgi:hypothetical protein